MSCVMQFSFILFGSGSGSGNVLFARYATRSHAAIFGSVLRGLLCRRFDLSELKLQEPSTQMPERRLQEALHPKP